jgi:hypothetical protein
MAGSSCKASLVSGCTKQHTRLLSPKERLAEESHTYETSRSALFNLEGDCHKFVASVCIHIVTFPYLKARIAQTRPPVESRDGTGTLQETFQLDSDGSTRSDNQNTTAITLDAVLRPQPDIRRWQMELQSSCDETLRGPFAPDQPRWLAGKSKPPPPPKRATPSLKHVL